MRVAAAIVRGDGILLVKHAKDNREYYMLPGGGLRWGESLEEALCRETEEETGLWVQAGRLLCVSETIYPDGSRHIVHLVFEGIERGGEIRPPLDTRVKGAEFIALRDLGSVELLPPINEFLRRACREDFSEGGAYLGSLWKEVEG